jgi:hypothetical protein
MFETLYEGSKRRWRRGRAPTTFQEMCHEFDLIEREYEEKLAVKPPVFMIGHEPNDQGETDRELRLRESERRLTLEAEDRRRVADHDYELALAARRGTRVRAWALMLVVLAVVATPIFAILLEVPANDFSQYIAPVTAIAGAVIGYWFGQTKDDKG